MRWSNVRVAVFMLLSCYSTVHGQTGHVVHGVGAINQSMAGAGTAMPLDATGALFWNPASITDLKSSEIDINGDLILVHARLFLSSPNIRATWAFPINLRIAMLRRLLITAGSRTTFKGLTSVQPGP